MGDGEVRRGEEEERSKEGRRETEGERDNGRRSLVWRVAMWRD